MSATVWCNRLIYRWLSCSTVFKNYATTMLWLFFNNSFWLGSQGVLCMLSRCFVYARKVFCVCPQGYEKASRSLRKGTAHLFRLLRAPRLITSEQPSDYFGTIVCLLRNSRLNTMGVLKNNAEVMRNKHGLSLVLKKISVKYFGYFTLFSYLRSLKGRPDS